MSLLIKSVDAFVAMGGNPDKSGHVTKTQIKQIIDEFELTIDLGEYLGKIQEEELCFEDFCDLFDTPFDDTKSYASLRSVVSILIERFILNVTRWQTQTDLGSTLAILKSLWPKILNTLLSK